MHDVLYSYCKVSQKRFVDVVCQQAVNYYLLAAEHSPLKIFNMQMVLRLNEDQLDTIAGEDLHIRQRREKLTRDIAILRLRSRFSRARDSGKDRAQ